MEQAGVNRSSSMPSATCSCIGDGWSVCYAPQRRLNGQVLLPASGAGMLELIRKCYDLVGRGKRIKWLALVALALAVTLAEAVGAALIYVLLTLVTDPQSLPDVPILGDPGRFIGDPVSEGLILVVALAIAIFFILRSVLVFGQTYVQQRVAHNAGAQLATRLLAGYLHMPYALHLQRNSAESIRNALQGAQHVITYGVLPAVRMAAESMIVVALLGVLVVVSPVATGLAVVVLGPIVWLMMRSIHPRIKEYGRQAQQAMRDSLQTSHQSLEGIRDVQLLGQQSYFVRDFGRSRRLHARSQYMREALAQVPPVLIETGLVLFIVAFFGVALLWQGEAEALLSVLGLFAYVGLRLQPSLRKIVRDLNNLKYAGAAVEDVHADLTDIMARQRRATAGSEGAMPFRQRLTFEGVGFSYAGTDTPALAGVNEVIHKGEAVGICGPTGGGKSTLVDLMVGLLEPTSGRVLVDGRDTHDDLSGWQRQLGVVSQAVFLLDGTLKENIALGVRDEEVDGDRLAEAVRMAQLEDFLGTLPHGIDTRVGERGTRLSGGQRQRVAIARALYRQPEVLVFDEGTSALDNETEAELVEAIEGLRGQRTVIMVAHRLTTVRRCDRILVVEAGRITDSGTFEELTRRNRLFADFAPQ